MTSFWTISNIQKNAMLNRGVIDALGISIPWIVTARNKDERIEKSIDVGMWWGSIYFVPLYLVKTLNKAFAKKYGVPSPKYLEISNEYLDIDRIQKDIQSNVPLEKVKSITQGRLSLTDTLKQLNLQDIKTLEEFKTLAPKIVKAKAFTLFGDMLFSAGMVGSIGWVMTQVTKHRTGKTGFSGEFNISSSENIERRAEKHRKKARRNRFINISLFTLGSIATALTMGTLLTKVGKGNMASKLASKMHLFDYTNGIFGSKLNLFIVTLIGYDSGVLLASRDKYELREVATKNAVLNFFYFIGDALLGGATALIIDKLAKTNLTRFRKFAGIKLPFERSILELENSTLPAHEKAKYLKLAKWNYITSLLVTAGLLGVTLPLINQYFTRKSVRKDDKEHSIKTKT